MANNANECKVQKNTPVEDLRRLFEGPDGFLWMQQCDPENLERCLTEHPHLEAELRLLASKHPDFRETETKLDARRAEIAIERVIAMPGRGA